MYEMSYGLLYHEVENSGTRTDGLKKQKQKHTTVGIRWWSPTQLLVYRSEAYIWQSGRDAQFSSVYGRMCLLYLYFNSYTN